MKTLLLTLALVLPTFAHAQWHCTVECKRSVDTIYYTISRFASGQEYSDFNAECTNIQGTSTFPGQSGCEYVYCAKFTKTTDVLSGYGDTLTEARTNAREGCPQGGSDSCGIMNFNEIGNYNCSQ